MYDRLAVQFGISDLTIRNASTCQLLQPWNMRPLETLTKDGHDIICGGRLVRNNVWNDRGRFDGVYQACRLLEWASTLPKLA